MSTARRARGQGAALPDPLHAAGRPDLLCAGRAGPGSALALAGFGERGRCAAVVRESRHGVAAHQFQHRVLHVHPLQEGVRCARASASRMPRGMD